MNSYVRWGYLWWWLGVTWFIYRAFDSLGKSLADQGLGFNFYAYGALVLLSLILAGWCYYKVLKTRPTEREKEEYRIMRRQRRSERLSRRSGPTTPPRP
jgi:hypothetical protein